MDGGRTNEDALPGEGGQSWLLTPHRSLPPAGFAMLMLAVSAVSFTAGLYFWSIGAWPVFGFFGLDVLLLYAAFRLNYRAAGTFERISLSRDSLEIVRGDPAGRLRKRAFNPYWVRLDLREVRGGVCELALTSHGDRLEIAHCLGDQERREFAAVLAGALAGHRSRL